MNLFKSILFLLWSFSFSSLAFASELPSPLDAENASAKSSSTVSPASEMRIISLKPNITEIVYALGAGDQLVGVTTFCDRPEQVAQKQKVGDYGHADVEKVMRLSPTHILNSYENSQAKEMHFLRDRGFNIHLFSFDRMEDIPASILAIGKVLQREQEARQLVDQYHQKMNQLKNAALPWIDQRVLFVVDQKPLVVVGSANWINDLIEWLGLVSVSAGNPLKYPHYNLEQIVEARPNIIVNMSMGSGGQMPEMDQWKDFPVVNQTQKVPFDIGNLRANHRLPEAGDLLIQSLPRLKK